MKAVSTLLLLLLAPVVQGQTLLLKNATIYTVRGPILQRGDILIRDGRIVTVGRVASIPAGAAVLDLSGKSVMPGIVDANGRFAMSRDNEQSAEVTPSARALNLLEPAGPELKRALAQGVTSVSLTPGPTNVIGGICAAVRTHGPTRSEMLIRDATGLRAALGQDVFASNGGFRGAGGEGLASIFNRRPNSRMAAVWELRKALFEADRHPALAKAVSGEMPLRIHARTENDIRVVFTLMDEFNLRRVILDDAVEAYKVADQIAARRIPVVLGPFSDPQYTTPESTDALLNSAGLLSSKEVRIAFGSNGGDPGLLRAWAAMAVRNGLPHDRALRAITLTAAEVAGVANRIGSIEAGKDADLLVLSGDPLQITSRIEKVVVRGQVINHDQ